MKNEFLKTKKEIIAWLDQHGRDRIDNYSLQEDKVYGYVVNVEGAVDLSALNLENIPVKFGKIGGYLFCDNNKLTSLKFCPETVFGHFSCSDNCLTSLEFGPQNILGNCFCYNNKLKTLEFCPQNIGGDFFCDHNDLVSLNFIPKVVDGGFFCADNPQLGEYEYIDDFSKIKEMVDIQKEHALLQSELQASTKMPTHVFKV